MEGKYYLPNITQDMCNSYPRWSVIREDRQSLGAQVLNAIAQPLEDFRMQLQRELANNWLIRCDCNGLGPVSEVELRGFTLQFTEDFPGHQVLIAPTMRGKKSGVWYTVSLTDPNSLETLFYESPPTRVSLAESQSIANLHVVVDANLFIAEVSQAPFVVNATLPFSNKLTVTITHGSLFYSAESRQQAQVTIKGKDRFGKEIVEKLSFLFNDSRTTQRTFSYVEEVDVTYLTGEDTHIRVVSGKFQEEERPILDTTEPAWTEDRVRSVQKWSLTTLSQVNPSLYPGSFGAVLQKKQYTVVNDTTFRSGYAVLDTVRETQLRTASGNEVMATGMALMPHRRFLFVVGDGIAPLMPDMLFIYDLRDLAIPNLAALIDKDFDAFGRIVTSSDFVPPGGELVIDADLAHYATDPQRSRMFHTYPDGTRKAILADGTEVADTLFEWQYRPDHKSFDPSGRVLIPTLVLNPTEVGDHIFTLETQFADETHTDQRVVTVDVLDAIVEISLASLVTDVSGVDFDIDGNLWVKAGGYYRLNMHNDRAVIDAMNNIAYFAEDYDEVEFT